MNGIQAVIFDMDGLLLDTERIALAVFLETCEFFGIGDQTEVFMQCVGVNQVLGDRILRQGLDGKVDYPAFSRRWEDRYRDRTLREPVPLKTGAKALLKELAKQNMPLAVATSTQTQRALEKLEKAEILDRFHAVIGGDQVEYSKPHPEIYRMAARTLGRVPEACLALEDSENGVRSAVTAGMTVIQIPDLVQPSPELRSLGHTVLGSLREVMEFVFGG